MLLQRIDDLVSFDLVSRMLESPAMWNIFVQFAEAVISANEEEDRAREREAEVFSSCRR